MHVQYMYSMFCTSSCTCVHEHECEHFSYQYTWQSHESCYVTETNDLSSGQSQPLILICSICHSGARTTASSHPHQSSSFDLNISFKLTAVLTNEEPLWSSCKQKYMSAAVINFQVLRVLVAPAGCSCTDHDPYNAPYVSVGWLVSLWISQMSICTCFK